MTDAYLNCVTLSLKSHDTGVTNPSHANGNCFCRSIRSARTEKDSDAACLSGRANRSPDNELGQSRLCLLLRAGRSRLCRSRLLDDVDVEKIAAALRAIPMRAIISAFDAHGFASGDCKAEPFHSLLDLGAAIEQVIKAGGITLHPGDVMKTYFRDPD